MILKNHDFKLEKCFQIWKNWANFMLTKKAHEINPKDVQNEIVFLLKKNFKKKKTGGVFFFGRDKKNNLCIVIKVRQRVPGNISIEETEKFLIFLLCEGFFFNKKNNFLL